MKKVTKYVLIALLVCALAFGAMLSTMMLSGASNLTPVNTYIDYPTGTHAVVLGKTGVRTGANTWKVTLGVTNLLQQQVSTKPIEVALVIDSSSSMTMYNVDGTNKTRLAVVKEAAEQMINDLYTKATTLGLTIKVSVSSFSDSTGVDQSMLSITGSGNKQTLINKIRNINRNGYTNLQGGILRGVSTFYNNFDYSITTTGSGDNRTVTATSINSSATFNDATSTKLMVVLSDGAANRFYRSSNFSNMVGSGTEGNPYAQGAAVMAANAVKDKNITIFSIGFAYSDSTLENVASSNPTPPPAKLYYTATTAVDLSTVFEIITNQVNSPALSDTMGSNLTTSSGTVTGPTGVTIGSNGALLSWTPTAADLAYNHGNFISYTVTLDITNIAAGEYNNQLLNNAASFGVVINGTTCNGNFPQPTCEYDIGTLDVQFKAGATQIATAEAQQKVITDWGTPTFTINTPPTTIVYNGQTYYYTGSTYDNNAYTVPGSHTQTAIVGTHTLIHNYALHNHNVTYAYTGTVPTGAPTAPASASYAAGTPNISVEAKPSLTGYTFNGWNSTDVTPAGGKFTMPDKDVAFNGSWTPNGNTAYKVEHYKQNTNGTYTLDVSENKTGTTGATAGYTQKSYTGYTYQPTLTTSTNNFIIAGDGSLVIKLYYALNTHSVSYQYTNTAPTGATALPGTTLGVSYGSTVTVAGNATAQGYTFSGWASTQTTATAGQTFPMPDQNVVFSGSWTPNANTAYTVEHYKQNLGGSYSLTPDDTDSLTGTTGTAAAFAAKTTYSGFTYAPALTSSNNTVGSDFIIKGDGTLVIKLYYTRNSYLVSYQYTGSVPTDATALPTTIGASYGATVTVAANAAATGYTFGGWATTDAIVSGTTFAMPANSVLFTGSFAPTTVNYTVNYYLQKLDGSGYELQTADTATRTGLTGAPGFYAAKSYTGYTFKAATSNNTDNGIFIIKADGSLVISVYYNVNIHNVSYSFTNTVPGASTLPATIGVSYGATVTVAGNATAPGYTFGGWASTQTTSTAGQTFTMPDGDVAFAGGFTPNENTAYIVNYYTQNLDGINYTLAAFENKAGTTGTTGSYDTTKTFTGFTFQKAESNLTPNTDFTIAGNGSLVINVYYTRNSYTVTYTYTGTVPAGVTPVNNFTVGASFGANVTVLSATYPNTHLFSGWTPTGIGVSTGTFAMPANNVTFTGSFSEAAAGYTVEHYTQNLTGGGFTKVDTIGASGNIGSAASFTPKSYEGFTFAPSLTTSTNTVGTQFIIKADGTLTIKLYYTRNSYEVSYSYTNTVPGASTLPATIGASYNATVTVAANGTAAGYTFSGWSTTDATVSGGTFTMPAKNVALSGGFTPNTNTGFKVEHYKQTLAGTYGTTPDDTDNLSGTTGTTALYTAKNYTGFTNDSSATTSNTGNFIIKGDGTLVIKLFYTRNTNYKYNVEYRKDSATGTLLDSKTVNNRTWGQTYSETAIDITGYTAQAPLTQNISIDADGKTMIFIYKANKHNVTYQLTGTIPTGFNTSVLAGLGATGVEFKTAMTRAADLTAQNYNFTGWTTSDVTVGASGNYTMPDQDVVFTGSFTLMPAWVVYEYTGDVPATAAALPETKYYNLNNGVTVAAAPAAVTGFTFEGWTRNGSAASNFTITTAGEYKIVGNWVRNSHKVTYQYDSSAPTTAPAVPTQATVPFEQNVFVDTTVGNITGYTFKGWVPTSGISTADITSGSFSMPNNDVVFTGSWAINKHNVSYQLTGEIPAGFNTSVLATLGASGVSYNAPMTVAGPLSFTNYEFHGWTSGQVTPSNGGYQMPDSDVVFTGYFTKKLFTVSYVYSGTVPQGAPALPAGGSYEVGKEVTMASPVSMMGYAFYGWSSNGVAVVNGKFTMPAHDVVFTGRWVQETSSVPSSIPSEPSIPSSTPSSVPSSVPSSTPATVVSSRPTVSINDTSAPLEVIAMGGEENMTATIMIAAFSAIMLAAVVVIGKKTRKVKK
ncbi:MAG TPA: VWA domain-containing protein [Oscillospiraceae bacterium]|nr:VWA domain-containing protein [Oscillospiraceae bacterium]HPS34155.1 VWA domain-containing protein [Oscillospiraceae bacterium]